MKPNKNHILALTAFATLTASAHSVALKEDFNGNYSENFPTLIEGDHQMPLAKFQPLFMDKNGVCQPWKGLKDVSASPEQFLGSHSGYSPAGTSNDWVVSRPVEIPTEGYTLSFGAQSYCMRSGDRLSDLWVFITETPPTEDALPTEPAMHLEDVSTGKYPDDIELDFIPYELNLDKYAGKTVYISFANLNTDKDIICIDDVLVQRLDNAELTAAAPVYALDEYEVEVGFGASTDMVMNNWTLTFDPGDGTSPLKEKGDALKPGEPLTRKFKTGIEADKTCTWTVTLTADGMIPITKQGTVTGLKFMPWHRVLLEEATGMWCGNCPMGIYFMEQVAHHPEMKDYVVPVSVHINQNPTGNSDDVMSMMGYASDLALVSAPSMRIDRGRSTTMFSLAHDILPVDFTDTQSVAYHVKKRHEELTLIDLDVTGEFVTEGNDTTAVKATVTLTPAITLAGKDYLVGFILTENNVGIDNNRYWRQTNYLSGQTLLSDVGGFTKLPEKISGWRYMDVARGIYDFYGHPSVKLPETMPVGEGQTFEVTLPIPDVRQTNSAGTLMSPGITAGNLSVVAFAIDSKSGIAANSAVCPLTEQAGKRMTIAEMMERLGYAAVEGVPMDPADSDPVYYNMQGIRVENPGPGMYVVRRGNTVTKETVTRR